MNRYYEEARDKLRREADSGTFGKAEKIMKDAVARTLEDFCRKSAPFAEAVAHGGSFEECMKAVARNVGNGIPDREAYRRAAQFYREDADVRLSAELTLGGTVQGRAETVDLSAFL